MIMTGTCDAPVPFRIWNFTLQMTNKLEGVEVK